MIWVFFLVKVFFRDDGFQIMHGYQLKFNTLDLKRNPGLKIWYWLEIKRSMYFWTYSVRWCFISYCKSPDKVTHFTSFGYKIRLRFNDSALVYKQNSDITKIFNIYIVYDLHKWPKNLLSYFAFKNCLFS